MFSAFYKLLLVTGRNSELHFYWHITVAIATYYSVMSLLFSPHSNPENSSYLSKSIKTGLLIGHFMCTGLFNLSKIRFHSTPKMFLNLFLVFLTQFVPTLITYLTIGLSDFKYLLLPSKSLTATGIIFWEQVGILPLLGWCPNFLVWQSKL